MKMSNSSLILSSGIDLLEGGGDENLQGLASVGMMGCVMLVEIGRRQEKETLISDKKRHDEVDNMRILLCGHGFLNEWLPGWYHHVI